jgi:prepilin-type N-terminal cleavage/methylation domain-containing protein
METNLMTTQRGRGFTLIELLIVVAIIAILAAIAVPNFLEAQVRAKVTRARADLRTIATAVESYRVDNNEYPFNDTARYSIVPLDLTAPIAYLSSADLRDPFSVRQVDPVYGDLTNFYSYFKIVTYEEAVHDNSVGNPAPSEAIDDGFFNEGALEKYGKWRLVSKGPDEKYKVPGAVDFLRGSDILYDPTNGSTSVGNIIRTQVNPEGYRFP